MRAFALWLACSLSVGHGWRKLSASAPRSQTQASTESSRPATLEVSSTPLTALAEILLAEDLAAAFNHHCPACAGSPSMTSQRASIPVMRSRVRRKTKLHMRRAHKILKLQTIMKQRQAARDLASDSRHFSTKYFAPKTPEATEMEKEAQERSQYFKQRRQMWRKMTQSLKYQPYRYLCVTDFEATCDKGSFSKSSHEIIEFPVVVIDLEKNATVVGEFHTYVRPTKIPILTQFCKDLTGITQEQVDAAPTLDQVLEDFDEWRISRGLVQNETHKNFAFVTDGPWDMRNFLDSECKLKAIKKPAYYQNWINIKKSYEEFYKLKSRPITDMLKSLGMSFKGRPHSGIDDSRNIARIVMKMARAGAILYQNQEVDLF
mmetsp:Transcript_91769/g.161826  ORF Transcript_91769/g.161826 Transcript_91769/m.161826 type:complete len:375 (-) Transcript_91769:118-1242(-)